jgi:hypothetical protein
MAKKQIFKVSFEKEAGSGATGIEIPFDVEKEFEAKRAHHSPNAPVRAKKEETGIRRIKKTVEMVSAYRK